MTWPCSPVWSGSHRCGWAGTRDPRWSAASACSPLGSPSRCCCTWSSPTRAASYTGQPPGCWWPPSTWRPWSSRSAKPSSGTPSSTLTAGPTAPTTRSWCARSHSWRADRGGGPLVHRGCRGGVGGALRPAAAAGLAASSPCAAAGRPASQPARGSRHRAHDGAAAQTTGRSPPTPRSARIYALGCAAVILLAAGLVWATVRTRSQRRAVARIATSLGQAPPPGSLQTALAQAVGDPELRIAYWLPTPSAMWTPPAGRSPSPSPPPARGHRAGPRRPPDRGRLPHRSPPRPGA